MGGLHGGHYTAYAKNSLDQWVQYNDSVVSLMSEEKVCTESAYLLFYRRVPHVLHPEIEQGISS